MIVILLISRWLAASRSRQCKEKTVYISLCACTRLCRYINRPGTISLMEAVTSQEEADCFYTGGKHAAVNASCAQQRLFTEPWYSPVRPAAILLCLFIFITKQQCLHRASRQIQITSTKISNVSLSQLEILFKNMSHAYM